MMRVTRSKSAETAVFDCLSRRPRRAVVAELRSNPSGLSEGDLAARVLARIDDGDGAPADDERVRVALHHKHLPKLAETGLVEYDREAGEVALGDHPALGDPVVEWALDESADEARVDDTFDALANERRQRILTLLMSMQHALDPREIAVLVAAREADASPRTVSVEAVDRVHTSMEHVHLPKLEAADLVEREDGAVSYGAATDLPARCVASGFDGDGIEAR